MDGTKVILGVLLAIAVIIILILIMVTIVLIANDNESGSCDACAELRNLPMYEGITAYFNSSYPYYNDGSSCRNFGSDTNWIEFDITNNSDTGIRLFAEKVSTNAGCSDSAAIDILNWTVPANGVKYPSDCMFIGNRFLSMFQNMFLQITVSSGANVPISFQGTSSKNEVQLAVPGSGKLDIVITGNSTTNYLANINIK